jgi:beta-glucosidase
MDRRRGRTYKYLKDPTVNSLWPFGFGLSYTTFSISQPSISSAVLRADEATQTAVRSSVTVTNTGTVAGDEVLFLYKNSSAPVAAWRAHAAAAAQRGGVLPPVTHPEPIRELIGFARVSLAPGASQVVHFNTTAQKLSSVDDFGTRHVLAGEHELIFSRGHGEELSLPLQVQLPTVNLTPPAAAADANANANASSRVRGRRVVLSTMVGLFGQGPSDLGLGHDEL